MTDDDALSWAKEVAERRKAEARAILKQREAPAVEPEPAETDPPDTEIPEPQEPPMSAHIAHFMDEYVAAQEEIERQRQRLIELRGGVDNLTPDDLDALENIRDLVAARYERLLEV